MILKLVRSTLLEMFPQLQAKNPKKNAALGIVLHSASLIWVEIDVIQVYLFFLLPVGYMLQNLTLLWSPVIYI